MKITLIQNTSPENLRARLIDEFNKSRFLVEIWQVNATTLNIPKVRLREKKGYCGNHPKSCEFKGHDHKHKKGTWLEGADWVEFNDLINDLCDLLRVACRVESSTCRVRIGRLRRVNYTASTKFANGTWAWDKVGDVGKDYEDWIGKEAGASKFPIGTPGIYTKINYNCVG